MPRKLLSQRHPLLYFLAVNSRIWIRKIQWLHPRTTFTSEKSNERLKFRVKKHQSKLIRKLGKTDMLLQYNKVDNLKLVMKELNGTLIPPGSTFSFCKSVGRPTSKRGFKKGMELSFGKARPGVGGGICQSSNLIHWLVLHSPLDIVERHHHSFDPFPDEGRVLPYASGATVFYNYRDFQFKNNTNWTFQLNLWMTDKLLEGEIRSNEELSFAYHVFEKNDRFIQEENQWFRCNEIWRKKIAKFEGGRLISQEKIYENKGRVMYKV